VCLSNNNNIHIINNNNNTNYQGQGHYGDVYHGRATARVHWVHVMNTEQCQAATDLWSLDQANWLEPQARLSSVSKSHPPSSLLSLSLKLMQIKNELLVIVCRLHLNASEYRANGLLLDYIG